MYLPTASKAWVAWKDFARELSARVLCPLEQCTLRKSRPLCRLVRGLLLDISILCFSRKYPANWFCVSSDCIICVFTTLIFVFLTGPLKWEKVPSASEKNSQSKAWYTVKKDSVHIKTKSFSFWSIFLCGGGGPKRKRATVFASKPNEEFDTICFRFYIYSDNEDSKKVLLFPCSIWKVTKLRSCSLTLHRKNEEVTQQDIRMGCLENPNSE